MTNPIPNSIVKFTLKSSLALVLGLPFFAISSNSFASVPNPLYRACVQKSGVIENIKVTYPKTDEVSFCRFGEAYIGAESLLMLEANKKSYAVTVYSQEDWVGRYGCQYTGGREVEGRTYENQIFTFCEYSDGSRMENMTLYRGPQDPSNFIMNKALGF